MRLRASLLVFFAASATACQSESKARKQLEQDGYSDIVLKKNDSGSFDFEAKKAATKQICKGTISVKGTSFSSESNSFVTCETDGPKCPADPKQCWGLGDAESDPAKAADYYTKGCDGGNPQSCTNLGVAYEKGKGVTANLDHALELWEKGCKLGAPTSCMNAAGKLDSGAVKADDVKLTGLLSQACKLKDDEGCVHYALRQLNGKGIAKNEAEAAASLKALCDKGLQDACGPLGILTFIGGGGITRDEDSGRKLMLNACEKGDSEACSNLAVLARQKKLPADLVARAGEFAESACDKEYADGCVELGLLLEHGEGGKHKDLPAAFAAQQKACKLGAGVGCSNVGNMLTRGTGAPRDLEGAKAAFKQACDLGFAEACK